jgi:hypothetical protein
VRDGAHLLEVQALSFFSKAGWNCYKRIELFSGFVVILFLLAVFLNSIRAVFHG